jgi:hypothetical protein
MLKSFGSHSIGTLPAIAGLQHIYAGLHLDAVLEGAAHTSCATWYIYMLGLGL